MDRIYLDNAATTAVSQPVMEAMLPYYMQVYGNPSSIHSTGRDAKKAVERARRQVAAALGCSAQEIYFTAGGSESDNWALKGAAFAHQEKGKHIITTQIEHHAILHTCHCAGTRRAWQVTVSAGGCGRLRDCRKQVENALSPGYRAGQRDGGEQRNRHARARRGDWRTLPRTRRTLPHGRGAGCSAAIPLDVEAAARRIMLSVSRAQVPRAEGRRAALYIRKGVKIDPLIHGGAQERGHRAGTENLPGIVGLGKAIELAEEGLAENAARMTFLRNRLISGLTAAIPNMRINGTMDKRLPNNVNVSFAGIEGEAVLLRLDLEGIAASSGSACTAGSLDPSHVLTAIGLTRDEAKGSLRLTLGTDTTQADIDEVVKKLPRIVESLREMTSWCGRG